MTNIFNTDESYAGYVEPVDDTKWQPARCGKCQVAIGVVKHKGEANSFELRCSKVSCAPDGMRNPDLCDGAYEPAPSGSAVQPQACTSCGQAQMVTSDGRFKMHYKKGRHPSQIRAQEGKS